MHLHVFQKLFLSFSFFLKRISVNQSGSISFIPSLFGNGLISERNINIDQIFFLVILVQVVIASPFLLNPVALAFGWKLGANTSLMDYLYFTKIITRPGDHGFAALYGLSFFWKFLDEYTYGNLNFPKILKLGIILVNVYYFFI